MTLKEHGNTYNLVRTSPLYLCGGVESPATPLVGGDVESPATPLAGGEVESPATPLVDSEVESPATPLADDEVESPTTPLVSGDVESPATPLAVERWSHLPRPLRWRGGVTCHTPCYTVLFSLNSQRRVCLYGINI